MKIGRYYAVGDFRSPIQQQNRQEIMKIMPRIPHFHKHFTGTATVRDIVIGMSDGLTVPFALAAGLSGAVDATKIVITAGLAEVAAGAIAMGLGGYLAAKKGDREACREGALRPPTED